MDLIEQIDSDLITALKAHQDTRVRVLRLVKNALANAQIQKQQPLTKEEMVQVVKKQAKDRQEAIGLYEKNGQPEAVKSEQEELDILGDYLPEELSDEAITPVIEAAIAKVNATSPADFGKVMGLVMAKLKGQADGGRIAELIKKKL